MLSVFFSWVLHEVELLDSCPIQHVNLSVEDSVDSKTGLNFMRR
jgi:hypothetical protein